MRAFVPSRNRARCIVLIGLLLAAVGSAAAEPGVAPLAAATAARYNVVWDTPSADYNGSMPMGNGDVALNAQIELAGDLVFTISKTDAWDDNGRLVKVGRVRISMDPKPALTPFRQTLNLQAGMLEAVFGEGAQATTLSLWVDANNPVIHIDTTSPEPVMLTASLELWRLQPYDLTSLQCSDLQEDRARPGSRHKTITVEPDTILQEQPGRIGWYHYNRRSDGPAMIAQIQGLDALNRPDPLLHRIFGGMITADGGRRIDDTHLQTAPATEAHVAVHVLSDYPSTPEKWLTAVEASLARAAAAPAAAALAAHRGWWEQFWDRSWIHISRPAAAAGEEIVPKNAHVVRVGVDQAGQNRFGGRIGRVSLYAAGLTPAEIATLAAIPADKPVPPGGTLLVSAQPAIGATLSDSAGLRFSAGMTIEAWISGGGGGRIVDKITPGGSDGFLLDVLPGNTLRVIAGDTVLTHADAWRSKDWTHVAAVQDGPSGEMSLYVNGARVGGTDPSAAKRLNDAERVSRAYALQRYIDACAGRGRYPIKFNGSLFTVPYGGDPDFRRWGPGYWWQNTRLPYLSMCASGDFEMMRPLFRMYAEELMPVHKFRTQLQTGHGGAFIPECIYFWGDQFTETYGRQPLHERQDKLQASGWHKWEWVSGPELTFMMLDYFVYTGDERFLRETLLPTAHEILTFFVEQYKTGEDGQLIMHPAMACETWWDCTNPMPELAGLHAVTRRLLALPEKLTTVEDRSFWASVQGKLPPLPTRKVGTALALAPATRFAAKNNVENPELYAVFPFRLCSFEQDNADLGRQALAHRWDRGNVGWRQDDLFMAYLGLTEQARANLVGRVDKKDASARFPAFWGPNYDWTPDQDHGGVMMKTVQSMLLQADPYSNKLYLLPAWPKEWNASFKLHAPGNTTIVAQVADGRITTLQVTPASRQADIVICPLQ